MSGYGQFCPVAKAMEVLDERWTILVLRELLKGSTRFNELRRGVPKMSPALLVKRLRSLERYGVIERIGHGSHTSYRLTAAGRELDPVIHGLAAWGIRWIGELGEDDLDPHLLMWDIQRTVPVEAWPRTRTVIAFELRDAPPGGARWWLVVAEGETDLCDYDPGYDVNAVVSAELRDLIRVWRGDLGWPEALRTGRVAIAGPTLIRRQVPTWIGQSELASVPRVISG